MTGDDVLAQVYVKSPDDAPKHTVLKLADKEKGGPDGERFCWYQCTVKGGREGRDIDALSLSRVRCLSTFYFDCGGTLLRVSGFRWVKRS